MLATLAFLVSLVALAVAAGAFLVANRDDASSTAGTGQPRTTSSELPTDEPIVSPEPTETSDDPGGSTTLNPTGRYEDSYPVTELTLNPGSTRPIDLDAPVVGGFETERSDAVYLALSAGGTQLSFEDVRLGAVRTADATPQQCVTAINTSPIDTDVKLNRDLTLCTITDGVGPPDQPQRPKLVLLQVKDVGDNGRTTVTVKAWTIPR